MRWGGIAVVLLMSILTLAGGASATIGSSSSDRSASAGLPLVKIHFEFRTEERATHYTVVNTGDSRGSLDLADSDYDWVLTPPAGDPGCNNHGVLKGQRKEFVWKHGNVGDPISDDGCDHEEVGPAGHEGTITVELTDEDWSCTATYTGTQAADGNATGDGPDGECERGPTSPPPPPPPPPSRPCKCTLLTARLLPASLNIRAISPRTDDSLMTWRLHWVLGCSKGVGGCNAKLELSLPPAGHGYGHWEFDDGGPDERTFACKGKCRQVTDGTIQLVDARTDLDAVQRRGLRVPIVIERTCQGKKTLPVKLWIAFKQNGDVDLKRSKLR